MRRASRHPGKVPVCKRYTHGRRRRGYAYPAFLPNVNTRPAGAGQAMPHCQIFSIAQKRRKISMQNFQYFPHHQFDVCYKKFRKINWNFFRENGVLVTSCFAILCKNGKCLKAVRMFSFEVRRNPKMPNGVKLNAPLTAISDL